ncbi:hypothetical protein OBBRIDRAFT_885642 [Obba rivulosa]|uniref:RING-type domain-containing protein n=1 Tax=Obba rivulosa TaxID=1052685 RepID=A0A8E2DP91_9APHY|nr:hypothetical protein OBBRIDRAFT_885642 [Obba rivulosa]
MHLQLSFPSDRLWSTCHKSGLDPPLPLLSPLTFKRERLVYSQKFLKMADCEHCKQPVTSSDDDAVSFSKCSHQYHLACFRIVSNGFLEECPQCRKNSEMLKAGLKICLCAGLGALAVPVVAPLALGIAGFSAAGPVAGTLAAAWQASIGSVAAGSIFALCQSIAMGGAIPAAGIVVGAAVAAAAGAAGGRPDGDDEEAAAELRADGDDEE